MERAADACYNLGPPVRDIRPAPWHGLRMAGFKRTAAMRSLGSAVVVLGR